jgi:integrase
METETKLRKRTWSAKSPHYLFWLRKNKTNAKGVAPLNLRITINGKRKDVSTGIFVPVQNWINAEIQGDTENILILKQKVELLKKRLTETALKLEGKGETLTARLVLNTLYPKPIYTPTFLATFKEFLKVQKTLIGIEFNAQTYQKYERVYSYLSTFLKHNYNRTDLDFCEVKAKLGLDFFHWMRTVKKCGVAYSRKTVGTMKAVIDFAIIEDYTQTNPLKALRFKSEGRKEIVFLSIEQLKKLVNTEFEVQALNITKDCFLFQCFTGLAYVDLCRFSTEHIQLDASGKTWIIISRAKTGSRSTIQILPEAQAIIHKYVNIDKACLPRTANRGLLPVFSNQVMNRLLKQIGLITGIEAHVMTTHAARKTFATTALNTNGVSIETVSAMLGHSNIKMTQQHYARVNQNKIGNEMQNFQFLTN